MTGEPVPTIPPAPENILTVFCADDHPDIAAMLRIAINREPDMKCVGCAHDAAALVDQVKRMSPRPRVAVVDLTMPGAKLDPLDAIRDLAAACPECRTIVYSAHEGPEITDRAIDAGAWGCVSKHMEPRKIIEAIRRVGGGGFAAPR